MERPTRKWPFVVAAIAMLLVVVIVSLNRRGQSELEAYKADLRAKGEKLTFQELAPNPRTDDGQLGRFVSAANGLGRTGIHPGDIEMVRFVAPGKARVAWRSDRLLNAGGGNGGKTWDAFADELERVSDQMAELREILKNPAPHMVSDYSIPFADWPKNPFVERRTVAQWLNGAALNALHERALDFALENIESLFSLIRFHADDPTLINQVIRCAIAGLALHTTWEALQAEGWSDAQLARLQQGWDAVDFPEMIERGFVGERALLVSVFNELPARQEMSPASILQVLGQDQLFALRSLQGMIEIARRNRAHEPWSILREELGENSAEFRKKTSAWGRYLRPLSGLLVPNLQRATGTCMRNEALRQLTIAAIALKRYQLRHGQLPPDLDSLVPDFLERVPFDCMDARPLKYRLDPDGTFLLYSVGEDGRDDGGSPGISDLFDGPDIVWPVAVFDANRL